jgi:hypothetical protein
MVQAIFRFVAAFVVFLAAAVPAAAEQFKVLTSAPAKQSGGTTAFIDSVRGKRIVEIDYGGNVVWQCSLASAQFKSAELQRGPDLEWIKADDTFLVGIPFSGVFRIDRKCNVVWRYYTAKVSHDADLLPNGNILHTWAWDSPGDYQAVEVDPSGKVVWRWQAKGHVEAEESNAGKGKGPTKGPGSGQGGGRGEGFTHANAVVRLPEGDTLVSLRNFNRVARVAPDGSVRRFYGPIVRVHDPFLLPDGTLIAANQNPMTVVALAKEGRRVVFENEIDIKPIRTVEQLAGGNFLITGGEDIVEIDGSGAVVWRVKIFTGLGVKIRDGVYKAVRVTK